MRVEQLMSRVPHSCTLEHSAADAARKMWEQDIGCVVVVDDMHQPIGMVTDRDISMAAFLRGKPISELSVREVASHGVFTCGQHDPISEAERIMRDWQVRRLPVVDRDGVLVGLLSLNDIILAGERSAAARAKQRITGELHQTLAAICRHRTSRESAAAS